MYVSDLREAEEHYAAIFKLAVLFRERSLPDGTWQTLPPGQSWEDAARSDITIGMVALQRDEFVLVLFRRSPSGEQLYTLGLLLDEEEIDAIAERLPAGARIESRRAGWLAFVDRYGMRWQLAAGAAFRPSRAVIEP